MTKDLVIPEPEVLPDDAGLARAAAQFCAEVEKITDPIDRYRIATDAFDRCTGTGQVLASIRENAILELNDHGIGARQIGELFGFSRQRAYEIIERADRRRQDDRRSPRDRRVDAPRGNDRRSNGVDRRSKAQIAAERAKADESTAPTRASKGPVIHPT